MYVTLNCLHRSSTVSNKSNKKIKMIINNKKLIHGFTQSYEIKKLDSQSDDRRNARNNGIKNVQSNGAKDA
ncbi:hypothetical protein V1478_016438 [Vespula squamosa]|uniref:Uncharacterized protein n=1 Tax=Vespula squamosa TaxID=30214 RepID=A0ABD1ZZS0_VESSQ